MIVVPKIAYKYFKLKKSIHLLMRNINFRWSVFVRDATSFAYKQEADLYFYSCVRTFCSVTDLIMNDSTEKKIYFSINVLSRTL